MGKTKWILFALLALLLVSCEISLTEPETASVMLSINDGSRTRTVLPNTFKPADSYTATLKSKTNTYKATSTEDSISFSKVKVGTYSISVEGTLNGQKVSEGSGTIKVSANTSNTATVQLNAVTNEENATGSISVTIDWSEAIKTAGFFKDMYNEGPFTFEFYKREKNENNEYTDTLLTAAQTAELTDTSYTFKADDIPVSDGFIGFFRIKVNGELVMDLGFVTFRVYAGQTSVPDANDADTFKITSSNAPSSANAVHFTASYGEDDPETTISLSIAGRASGGNQLYKSLTLSLYDASSNILIKSETISGDLESGSDTITYTFTGLTAGKTYRADVVGTTQRGKKTAKSSAEVTTKVFVTGITADTLSEDEETLSHNGKLSLSASVQPSNATVNTVEWTTDNSNTLTLTQMGNNVLVYGNKPGVATLLVNSTDAMKNGEKAQKTVGNITVILETPEVTITTERDSETAQSYLSVSWNVIDWATSYEVYRSENGAEAVKVIETENVCYDDEDITAGYSYSYAVKALTTESTSELNLDSSLSALSASYTPVEPTITLVQPTFESLSLQIVEGTDPAPEDITVTPANSVVLSIPEIEGAVSTEWLVNGKSVKSGNSVELTYDMPQVQDMDADSNALTLEVTNENGDKSSATIYFRVVSVVDTGVEEFKLSEFIALGSENLSIKTNVLPYDATLQTVTYTSSDESVATVDTEGNITVLKIGTVTFTAESASGYKIEKTTTFYNALTEETLMSLVANYLKTNISAANSSFGGDWWNLGGNKYNQNGISISSPHSTSQSAGSISISETDIGNSATGSIKIKTTTNLSLWAKNEGAAGYLGTDPLRYVAYGGTGVIVLSLPYGQGSATITFPQQLDVIDKSGTYQIYMSGRTAKTFSYSSYPVL